MDTLRNMRFYVRAIELDSLSAVAREQGCTQPTISKAMTALEKTLGVRLFERSTTTLAPTTQGQRFYERAKRVLEEFDEAVADARGLTGQAAGLLRVNAPVALGQFALGALVQDFLKLHPAIEIELILNDRLVDLVEEGVDVALRLSATLPPDAVARKVARSARGLVAAPSYLEQHPRIRKPEDLARHDYIRFAWLASGDEVELAHGGRSVTVATHGRYRVNNALSIRDALAAGAGVGLCPAWLVHDLVASGRLRRVLPQWQGSAQELFLLAPSRRYQPLRARLFMEFAAAGLSALPGFTPPG